MREFASPKVLLEISSLAPPYETLPVSDGAQPSHVDSSEL